MAYPTSVWSGLQLQSSVVRRSLPNVEAESGIISNVVLDHLEAYWPWFHSQNPAADFQLLATFRALLQLARRVGSNLYSSQPKICESTKGLSAIPRCVTHDIGPRPDRDTSAPFPLDPDLNLLVGCFAKLTRRRLKPNAAHFQPHPRSRGRHTPFLADEQRIPNVHTNCRCRCRHRKGPPRRAGAEVDLLAVLPPPVQKFSFYRIGRACLNMFSNFGWGAHIGFGEGAEFGTGRGRQHGDADVPGKEAVLALDGVPVFPAGSAAPAPSRRRQ
jgi:hypothetical protein